jgi:hypothetical protein
MRPVAQRTRGAHGDTSSCRPISDGLAAPATPSTHPSRRALYSPSDRMPPLVRMVPYRIVDNGNVRSRHDDIDVLVVTVRSPIDAGL